VAGGGSALTQAVSVLKDKLNKTGDEAAGVEIIRIASVEPLRWIAQNAGAEGYVVTAKVAEMKTGEGYNAATGEFGNLLKAGIVDPVKVTRSALQNAASIAAMLLTTDVLIVEKKADQVDSAKGHGHGPGGHSH
jgi:chaperonin GroEL